MSKPNMTCADCCVQSGEATPAWWRTEKVLALAVGALLLSGLLLRALSPALPAFSTAVILLGVVLGSTPIFWRAVIALFQKRLDADVLVAIAVIASVSIGEFLAAGEVIFIMLLGQMLESYTVERARRSIGNLMELAPRHARVRRDGQEVQVPVEQVQPGELVIVKAGEKVPVDGIIRAGTALINQSAITGESLPVEKAEGDEVFSGTINELGALIVEATRIGQDTTLSKIAQLVQEAQQRRAPIQRVVDRYAGWAVPLMLLAAVLVFAWTKDAVRAITVLIVACPCALILATPTAIVAAIGRAAKEGILIKGGAYLEAAARLNTVVFDKTGTLTKGKPAVTDVTQFDEHDEAQIVGLAAVAEKMSEHPLAQAILQRASELELSVPDPKSFEMLRGQGVVAEFNGQKIFVGKPKFIKEQNIQLTPEIEQKLLESEAQGKTVLIVAHDDKPCAIVSIADELREKAAAAIVDLHKMGVNKVVMLTGDNPRTARTIAKKVGIKHVAAEVHPEQKAQRIEAMRAEGERVAMVGDGINDAPALATADVGVAMGKSGTDVAVETANIALMTDDLTKVAFAVGLSRKAIQIIKQGLWFALFYNIVMVSTAAEGHVGPALGAVMHQLSSLVVILNAMRLLRYRQ